MSSETRERYCTDFTSLTLKSENGNQEFTIGMDTDALMVALCQGGLTPDDMRNYADIIDASAEEKCDAGIEIPGRPITG